MELKIKNAEESKKKTVHTQGTVCGLKKWAGREVLVVLMKKKKYT